MKGSSIIYASSLLCLASIFVLSAPFENHPRSREENESKFVFPLWSKLPAIKEKEETQLLGSRDYGEKHSEGVGIITRELTEENNRALAEERRNEWKDPEENEEWKGEVRELVTILKRELEEKEDETEQSKNDQKIEAVAEGEEEEEDDDDEEEILKSEIVSSAQKKSLIRGLRRELPKKVVNELLEMLQRREPAEEQHKREFTEEEEESGKEFLKRSEKHQMRERHKETADKMASKGTKRENSEKKLTKEERRYHSEEKGGRKQGKRVPSLEQEQEFTEKGESTSEFGEESNDEVADERQNKPSEEQEKERFMEPKQNQERKDRREEGLTSAESKNAVERSREEPEELQEERTKSGTDKQSREEGGTFLFNNEEFLPPVSLPKRWFEHQFEKEREGTNYHEKKGRGREKAGIIHGEKREKELEKEIEEHKQRQRMGSHGLQKERENFWFRAPRGETEQQKS